MDWKAIIGTVAPWIATAISGPLGGMAVGAAADALGLSEKTEGAIKQALSGVTPEQMMALKNADHDFSAKMQELGFQNMQALAKIDADDRASAREREIKTGDSITPRLIAMVVIAGFFAVLLGMMFLDTPQESREPLLILLGSLGAAFTAVIAYFFGSTAGSAEKTRLLANSQPTK